MKMARNIWMFFIIIKCSYGFLHSFVTCPSDKYCECNENDITCASNEPDSTLNLGLFHPEHQPSRFEVRGFHTVNLQFHFLQDCRPDTFIISNISNLIIDSLAFVGSGDLEHLEISDIKNLTAKEYSLYAVTDNKNIVLRNVKIKSGMSNSVSIKNTENIVIANCEFDTVSVNAVQIKNVSHFVIQDSVFKTVEAQSFLSDTTEHVILQNVSIENMSTSSFTILSSSVVTFKDCVFGTLSSGFISGTEIDTFSFLGNKIQHSEPELFRNLTKIRIIVKDNTFFDIQDKSLPLSTTNELLDIKMNKFNCSCTNTWLWDTGDDFLKNNLCLQESGSGGLIRLADLKSLRNNGNHSTCSGLSVQIKQTQKLQVNEEDEEITQVEGKEDIGKTESDNENEDEETIEGGLKDEKSNEDEERNRQKSGNVSPAGNSVAKPLLQYDVLILPIVLILFEIRETLTYCYTE